MRTRHIIHASHAAALSGVFTADCEAVLDATDATDTLSDIQLFPPGTHKIRARRGDGQPWEGQVTADAAAAEAMQAALSAMLADAAAGTAAAPYIDFSHKDDEAAGHPVSIYWAGSDAKTGGIRAKIALTEQGRAKIRGRAYTKFSPTFSVDAAGRPVLAGLNLGGLVNRPAFTQIATVTASADAKPAMTPDEQIAKLTADLAAAQAEITAQKRVSIEAQIEAAAKAGRIADDATLKAKWIEAALADHSLLALIPAAPAAPAPVAPAPFARGSVSASAVQASHYTDPLALTRVVMAAAAERKLSVADAVTATGTDYVQYRKNLLNLN
jgi:hypothetical protein